jgi:hypothetical protein
VTKLGYFLPSGLILVAHYEFFEKMKEPKEMATFWATFCLCKFVTFSPKQAVPMQGLL